MESLKVPKHPGSNKHANGESFFHENPWFTFPAVNSEFCSRLLRVNFNEINSEWNDKSRDFIRDES